MGFIACVACIASICGLGGWQTAQEYRRRSTDTQAECVFNPRGPERANSTADISLGRPGESALLMGNHLLLCHCVELCQHHNGNTGNGKTLVDFESLCTIFYVFILK